MKEEHGKIYKDNNIIAKSFSEKIQVNNKNQEEKQEFTILAKSERYIKYIIKEIQKIPKSGKYSIGTYYMNKMFDMYEMICYINITKIENRFETINKIDASIGLQKMIIQELKDLGYISNKSGDIGFEMLTEIGKMLGGLIKYYKKIYKN